ncbi:MAG: hypothetical protein R2867_10555 [Caldilineaceae bacterium]
MAKAGDPTMLNGPYMDGLALHYYTAIKRLPDGNRVGSATEFDEAQWIEIIAKGLSWTSLCVATPPSWTSTIQRSRWR